MNSLVKDLREILSGMAVIRENVLLAGSTKECLSELMSRLVGCINTINIITAEDLKIESLSIARVAKGQYTVGKKEKEKNLNYRDVAAIEITDLKEELDYRKTRINNLTALCKDLKKELEQKNSTIAKLEDELNFENNQRNKLITFSEDLKKEIAQKNEALKEAPGEISQLGNNLESRRLKMPLKREKVKKTISYNIAQEIRSGKSRSQAVAIAYSKASKSRKKRRK